jgi:hypothetical protein
MKKKIVAFLLLFTMLSYSGCAPLMAPIGALLTMVLMLPFQIIAIVFNLIPVALKYAPYALIFLVKNDQGTEEFERYAQKLNDKQGEDIIRTQRVDDATICYRVELLRATNQEKSELLSVITPLLQKQKDARIFFSSDKAQKDSPSTIYAIFDSMRRAEIKAAKDSRLVLARS